MRYIVKQIIDRWPVGDDVTERYLPDVAKRLVDEGYLTAVDDSVQEAPVETPVIAPQILPVPDVVEDAAEEDGR